MRTSVVLSTYNGERYLREQLLSLAGQTRPPSEVLVRDDGSTDHTVDILEEVASAVSLPVRLLDDDDGNIGFLRSFERLIAAADGDVIALCDQDDIWYPRKIELIEERLGDRPEAAFFFSDADLVDDVGRPLGRTAWSTVGLTVAMQHDIEAGAAFHLLRTRPYVTGATLAFRSSARELILPFPDLLFEASDPGWHLHDGWIALILSASMPGIAESEPLIAYRQHAEQAMSLPDADAVNRVARVRNTADTYAADLRNLEPVMRRLTEHAATRDLAQELSARHEHLAVRLSMLGLSRTGRIRPIVRELRSRRYARFSAGFTSGFKDLLSPRGPS